MVKIIYISENSCLTREMAALPISQVEFVVIPYIFPSCLGVFVAIGVNQCLKNLCLFVLIRGSLCVFKSLWL